jgi:glycosyltransferase involved in cell wall biosynthesis
VNPTVSVIVPVYNGAPYLAKSLASVLAQSHVPHEVIVVDDGSTDSTPEVLEKFKDCIVIKRIPNQGVSNARNIGMDTASGDYFAFMDHDDLWFKNKLQKQVEIALQYPDVGLVCCNYFLRVAYFGNRLFKHYQGLRHRGEMNWDTPINDPFGALLKENFVGTASAVLVKKTVADRAGGFEKRFVVCEDYHYWLRCARRAGVVALAQPLMYKRTHTTNLSNDQRRIFRYNRMILADIAEEEKKFMNEKRFFGIYRRSVAAFGYDLGDECFRLGYRREGLQSYREALEADFTLPNIIKFFMTTLKKLLRSPSAFRP